MNTSADFGTVFFAIHRLSCYTCHIRRETPQRTEDEPTLSYPREDFNEIMGRPVQ